MKLTYREQEQLEYILGNTEKAELLTKIIELKEQVPPCGHNTYNGEQYED